MWFGFRKGQKSVPTPDLPEETQDSPNAEFLAEVTAWGGFDPAWYLTRYPDIAGYPYGPLIHFCIYGLFEHRDPSPHVSVANYLRRHPEGASSPLPALIHALRSVAPDLWASAWLPSDEESLEYLLRQRGLFDDVWYLARNRDVASSGLTAIQHFVRHGARELRDPSAAFDSDFYRDRYPNYQTEAATPIEHYVRFGERRGNTAAGLPKYERWLDMFDRLTPADLDRIAATPSGAFQPIVAIHILDASVETLVVDLVERWAGQIGAACRVRFLRGAGLSDAAWAALAASIAGLSHLSLAPAAHGLAELDSGTEVILCAGATLVRPHTVHLLRQALRRPDIQAVYGDHDHIDTAGTRTAPVFKPAMSPEFMRRVPYAGALIGTVVRDETRGPIAAAIEAAASGDGAGAWAAYLLGLPPKSIERVPFLIAHSPASAGHDRPYEPTPNAVSRPAENDEPADSPRVSVTIVIPTRDQCDLLRACVDSLRSKTDYPSDLFDIVIVDNGSVKPETLAYFEALRRVPGIAVVSSPGSFNFSKICNEGAAAATGSILVFLNDDMAVRQQDWLSRMVGFARRPQVGVVGARLLYPDGTVQHGGVVLGVQGVGAHRLVGTDAAAAAQIDVTREMTSMTGACLALRRQLFFDLGGFDALLAVTFNDVELCASAWKAGYQNIYLAESLFDHHESKSRGSDAPPFRRLRSLREAIHVRGRHGDLFRDDPSYSPNLSLTKVGDLAVAPRVVRPWRRSPPGIRRVLLLSRVHGLGHGVAIVLQLQARFLRRRGWDVTVGGPVGDRDIVYEGCRRVDLWTAEAASAYAVAEGMDCVIAHTPPFFSMTRHLGRSPLVYFVDHGEPPPGMFPDQTLREHVDWEKRFCAALATRVFAISRAVFRQQYRDDAIIIRNGNSHLATWNDGWAARRQALRAKFGFEGCFVVLSVSRFGPGELFYKGIRRFGEVASDAPFRHPCLAGRIRCVIAGRGDEHDVRAVEAMGLSAFPNLSDDDLVDLYAASDLYISLSAWEGYNLGIGQALAMGLEVIASNIDAHREFDIETLDSVPDICDAIARHHAAWNEKAPKSRPSLDDWDIPLTQLAETIERDLAAHAAA